MNKQLAPIKEYGPPYYKERAWNLEDFQDWEREMLTAVKLGGQHSIEDDLAQLEVDERTRDWATRQPYLNAFVIPEKRYQIHADIIAASKEQLREWRQFWAQWSVPFDPKVTEQMIAELAQIEEDALEDLRWAYAEADKQLAALYTAMRERLGIPERDDEPEVKPKRTRRLRKAIVIEPVEAEQT